MDINLVIQICILRRFLMLGYLSLGIVQPSSHVPDVWDPAKSGGRASLSFSCGFSVGLVVT